MSVRLRNQRNSHATLGLSSSTWSEILRLAFVNGWQPMGSIQPELPEADLLRAGMSARGWDEDWLWRERYGHSLGPEALLESYLPVLPEAAGAWAARSRLVLLEDALNFVDALDRAYQAYEPVRVPASYFLFEPDDPVLASRPSLGALAATIEVCRQGSFSIEPWRSRL